ncbi:hypothetical protein [Streptomyces sp. NPDC048295]|uniref:hypothetical protein n=1 Tax=Streptomyces sp. NPDC048295 TaxID=3154617 RepID=UPI00341AB74F
MPTSRLRQPGDRPFTELPTQIPTVDGKLRLSVNAFLVVHGDEHTRMSTLLEPTSTPPAFVQVVGDDSGYRFIEI